MISARRFASILLLVPPALLAAACGGNVVVDQGGTTHTGSGGGVTGGCPSVAPTAGASCSPEGESCSYGTCCPNDYTCTGGVWNLMATGGCVFPGCPATPPNAGSSCDPCGATSCTYDCPGFSVTYQVTCPASKTWTYGGACPG